MPTDVLTCSSARSRKWISSARSIFVFCLGACVGSFLNVVVHRLPLGMSLSEIVRSSTETPANAIRRPDLGSLKPGTPGDVSVLSMKKGSFDLEDVRGEIVTVDERLFAEGCVIGGKWFKEAGKVVA